MNLNTYLLLKPTIFKKTLLLKCLLLLGCCYNVLTISAQNFDELDSLLIDRNIENYSVRLFTNFKVNKFNIKNQDSKIRFVPNNRHGIGFGFANRKIILDIAFNLKNPNREETRKFDLQGTTIIKDRHYINFYGQSYKGFTAKNNIDEPFIFRSDMRSVSIGFNYLYTFDGIEFSYALLKAGLSEKRHRNIIITGGVGAFASFDYFSANSSILSENISPYFNEEGNIERYKGLSFGVLAGFISYFKLPEGIVATVNIIPGIGFMAKKINLPNGGYKPADPMLYKLDFSMGVGYSFNQFYVNLTYSNGMYSTDLDYGNKYLLNLTNAKLALGYRFSGHKRNNLK
ncbi:DUF4421 family protein [Winogradskyella bathintestinalis]|uniref:DUF4421 family protein n=1 Tax=Winogradskyella bathintestinalis TaxID=3035208 RepID=A0ABT7ZVR4_9FLAO|nr:DUF4421 family protein [Winogradskyella bathintestinalis]MDN3493111.1 DUF4421 family protein [Winogradskyella bathintestinalis]